MQAEWWQEVEKLFHAALGRASHERIAYLREASEGDPELTCEVESLLAACKQTGSLETAASHLAREWLKDQLVGRSLGHFQVLAYLGSGGMGEVYLAEDNRLRRKVALKLLARDCIGSEGRLPRFEREALAASALNHPNIVTIHEIDESDGVPFIATEFVEGQTLRALVNRERLDTAKALDIVEQVARALEAAHAAGIIHRDIKPENIMVRADGLVKILDFGIAKLIGPQSEAVDKYTIPGMMIGTTGYMSPEQTRGLELDARTDIFSLGVVLYEMIAGQAPFQGHTKSDLIAEILKTEPLPLGHYSRDLPRELENIVNKALRKDREERYQTVKDLLVDLKGLRQEVEFGAKQPAMTGAVAAPGPRWGRWLAWTAEIVVVVAGLGALGCSGELRTRRLKRRFLRLGIISAPTTSPASTRRRARAMKP
jgi:predicted Ser/Thr protein kinase